MAADVTAPRDLTVRLRLAVDPATVAMLHRVADALGVTLDDTDAPEPADEQPATVGPEPLEVSICEAIKSWLTNPTDDRTDFEALAGHVCDRLAQYPADTPASQVYADWFGAR